MNTQNVWNDFNDQLYFFILKKVKDENVTNDIFQNTFLKIHKNLSKLKEEEKIKAWVFQIARNEIVNYFKTEPTCENKLNAGKEIPVEEYQSICCFD
ncbi:MAG: sigma factor, partial [Bacteroidota bacterium]